MPTLAWPTIIAPSAAVFRLLTNTQTFRSPLDGTRQTIEQSGAAWAASLTWNTLNENRWRLLSAWIASLRGPAGRFYLSPPHAILAKGAIAGSPVVNGAGQTGVTLAISSAGVSVTNVFRAGDYISFDTSAGREMKIITADANSNGSGQVTVSISPPIRTSPANAAAIVYSSPSAIFMLTDDAQGAFEYRPGVLAGLTLDVVEAVAV